MKDYEKFPLEPRIGLWGNYGFQKPLKPLGRWIGGQMPEHLPGKKLEQKLMEGILRYRVGCLFDREKPRKEQIETILILETRDPQILEAMWLYDTWKKEDYNERDRENGPASDPSGSGSAVPW